MQDETFVRYFLAIANVTSRPTETGTRLTGIKPTGGYATSATSRATEAGDLKKQGALP